MRFARSLVSRLSATRSFAVRRVPFSTLYTKEHEYLKADGDLHFMGISDHAQSELGDVVFVELPEVGAEFAKV